MGSVFPSNLDGLVTKAEVMFCDFLGWIIKETHPQWTLLGHLLLEPSHHAGKKVKNYTESPRSGALAENPRGVLADSQQQLPDSE